MMESTFQGTSAVPGYVSKAVSVEMEVESVAFVVLDALDLASDITRFPSSPTRPTADGAGQGHC